MTYKLTAPSQWSRITENAIDHQADVRPGMGILADSMGILLLVVAIGLY